MLSLKSKQLLSWLLLLVASTGWSFSVVVTLTPSTRSSSFRLAFRSFAFRSHATHSGDKNWGQNRTSDSAINIDNVLEKDYPVTILAQTETYVVVSKPAAIVCHHSEWTGSRALQEVPMLQRTRDTINRRVNLVHRLDRGCSGCLLMTCAEDASNGSNVLSEVTAELINAMARPDSNKTYIALVRGEGILHDRDFRKEGWFMVDRPIKDERGMLHNATTWFRFVAGQDNDRGKRTDRARASVVLCRPVTGRWHQIRKHLNSLSHPILGDSSHGSSRTNREWKESRGMLPERTCLHLARIQLGPANLFPGGIDVECPLAEDMLRMLKEHTPSILDDVRKALLLEGIHLPC